MSGIPIGRIATGTHLDLLQSSIRRLQEEIARRELEIATGIRVRRPADNPLAAVRALGNRTLLQRGDQYLKNIALQAGELSAADGALGGLTEIAHRAQEILLAQIGDTATPETRRNAAAEVEQLLEDAVALANRKFGDRFLFGGADALFAPLELTSGLVAFRAGALAQPEVNIGRGSAIGRGVTAAEAFGGMSAVIEGQADLDPRLTLSTRLSDLNAGQGVRLGPIRIRDGLGGDETVDLSAAETVGDAIDLINAGGIVAAALNASGNGLELAAAGADITVTEVESGQAAGDLGILSPSGAGPTLTGGDVDPRLSLHTLLSDLRGGLGIDPPGFTVANGPITAGITLLGASTVEDLLNALNGAGAQLLASLAPGGSSIDLRTTLTGARLSVAEGAGATAAQLGLLLGFADTPLDRLNGGLGVGEAAGSDFRIVDRSGAVIEVDISTARTVQDVIDLINGDPENPGTLLAGVAAGANRIQLDDSSVGAEDLRVESTNAGFAAESLGIAQRVASPGSTLVGRDLAPAGVQADSIFNALIALRDGLAADDRATLSLIQGRLDRGFDRLLDARADAGARVQRLERARDRFEDEAIELEALIEDDRGVDLAEAVAGFQREQTILQAAFTVTGRILSLSLLDFLR